MASELLKPVKDYLAQHGYRFRVKRGELRTGFRCSRGLRRLRVREHHGALCFLVPELLHVNPTHRETVLARVAALNYDLVLVRFAVDRKDGEVRADLVIPPSPHAVTVEQVELAVSVLLNTADEQAEELMLLNVLGHDPRSKPAHESVPEEGQDEEFEELMRRLGAETPADHSDPSAGEQSSS